MPELTNREINSHGAHVDDSHKLPTIIKEKYD
jgi:hypothetical protein